MTGKPQDSYLQPPKFYFRVGLGIATYVPFQKVDETVQLTEYRRGNIPAFSLINTPEIRNKNVTLKKGFFANDNNLIFTEITPEAKAVVVETIEISHEGLTISKEGY